MYNAIWRIIFVDIMANCLWLLNLLQFHNYVMKSKVTQNVYGSQEAQVDFQQILIARKEVAHATFFYLNDLRIQLQNKQEKEIEASF